MIALVVVRYGRPFDVCENSESRNLVLLALESVIGPKNISSTKFFFEERVLDCAVRRTIIQSMSESTDPTTASSEHDFNELIENIKTPTGKSKAVRQGLPSQYRMRHDAHYVEELATRSGEAAPEEPAVPSAIPMPAALRDLCQEFEGLASCFNLIEHGARPLRERIGLSLA